MLRFRAKRVRSGISAAGARVETENEMQLASEGGLVFVLPESDEQLRLRAHVSFVADEAQLHYGLSFIEPTATQEQALEAFVAGRLKATRTHP